MNYKYILLLIFFISCSKVKTNNIPIKKEKKPYTIIRIKYEPYEIYSNKLINIEYRNNKVTTNIKYWYTTNGGNNSIWVMKNNLAKKYFNISNECEYKINDIDLNKWSGPKNAEDVKGFNEINNITTRHIFLEDHKDNFYIVKWKDKYTNYKLGDKVELINK